MSLIEKCFNYALTHGGEFPNAEERGRLAAEQLQEYIDEITSKVVLEYHDKSIICAAYKLIYESLYNMLEPNEKEGCDELVNHARVTNMMKRHN